MRRWLALIVLALSLVVGLSKASGEPVGGLSVTAYLIDQVPPARSDTAYPVCNTLTYPNIDQSWGSGVVAGCRPDRVMLHYTGYITIPDGVQTVRFALSADDGSDNTIASNYHFGSWRDKGCSTDYSARIALPTGVPLPIDAWFYENGGGTCFRLYWQFDGDNQNWTVVPPSAFAVSMDDYLSSQTTTSVTTTTSTSTTSTTSTTTTTEPPTTEPSTTTLVVPPVQQPTIPTTTEPSPTTTQESTTTSSLPTPTETTTSTTIEPSTTTTFVSPTTTQTPTTSTTVGVEPGYRSEQGGTTTVAPTTTIERPRQGVTGPSTTVSQTTAPTTVPPTTTVPQIVTTTTLLPAPAPDVPASQANDQVVTALASNPEVLATASVQEVVKLFDAVSEDQLTDQQGAQLVAAVQNAPIRVRKAFEAHINVFAGHTDTYIPIGSTVPVRARRIIIIVTVLMSVAVTPRRRRA